MEDEIEKIRKENEALKEKLAVNEEINRLKEENEKIKEKLNQPSDNDSLLDDAVKPGVVEEVSQEEPVVKKETSEEDEINDFITKTSEEFDKISHDKKEEKKHKKSKKKLFIVLLIIVALLIAGFLVYYFVFRKTSLDAKARKYGYSIYYISLINKKDADGNCYSFDGTIKDGPVKCQYSYSYYEYDDSYHIVNTMENVKVTDEKDNDIILVTYQDFYDQFAPASDKNKVAMEKKVGKYVIFIYDVEALTEFTDKVGISSEELEDYMLEGMKKIEAEVEDEEERNKDKNSGKRCDILLKALDDSGWKYNKKKYRYEKDGKQIWINNDYYVIYGHEDDDNKNIFSYNNEIYGKDFSTNCFVEYKNDSSSKCGLKKYYNEYRDFEKEVLPTWDFVQAFLCSLEE